MAEKPNLSYFKSLPPPYAVIGLGITGTALVELLHALGAAESQILTYDEKDSAAQFRTPESLLTKKPGTFFVSPGVPLASPWIQSALKQGVTLSSECSLSFSLLTSERVIAITGSVGKSTTTSVLGAGAQALSSSCFVGGNLGVPLAKYTTSILSGGSMAPWVILELSSYQLENFENLKCEFSAITYLTPNHMERYSDLSEYYRWKLSLIKKTEKVCVLNSLGGDLEKQILAASFPEKTLAWANRESKVLHEKKLLPCALLGNYNRDNLAMAATLAELAGWPEKSFVAMKNFAGLPHRLENLGQKKSVTFINDSKATTIESVLQATKTVLEGLDPQTRLFLLLGGHDKNLPWDQLKPLSQFSTLQFLFFGEFGESAKKITGFEGPFYPSLSQALEALPKLVQPKDTVLLSPGGTSHDEFKNFEERGRFFKKKISELF